MNKTESCCSAWQRVWRDAAQKAVAFLLPQVPLRCGFGSLFGYLLMRVPQLRVKARLAQSARFAAIALREVMTAGWTIEVRAGHTVDV
jgi:hypothetical protein